jgi:peptide/nickel transport system permease protein
MTAVAHPIPAPPRLVTIRRMMRRRAAIVAFVLLLIVVLASILADLLPLQPPDNQTLREASTGPSAAHWLGTDSLGRDVLSRLIYGSRVSLGAAFLSVAIGLLLGIPVGLVAGYGGRWFDAVSSLGFDAVMSIPPIVLALAVLGVAGPGLANAMLAIGIVLAPRFYRLARAATHAVRSEPYMEAARSLGASTTRMLFRHVLPNASSVILVEITFSVGVAIVAESSLSFLGLGVREPQSSWGSLIKYANEDLLTNPFPLFPAAILMALSIYSITVLGDSLRDALGRQRLSDK